MKKTASGLPSLPVSPASPAAPAPAAAKHLALALALGAAFAGSAGAATPPADLVVTNGKVVTLDRRSSIAQAVAVRDGAFVFVGNNAGAKKLVGPSTRVLDAQGKTVVPGLIETHCHTIGVARGEANEPFRLLSSFAEVQEWARDKASRTKEGQWIRIPRVDLTRYRERRFPTREELDQALPARPLVFDWSYAGLNQVLVLNSAALKAAGITRDTKDPPGGRIVRDAQGNPTGMLRNARALVAAHMPSSPPVDEATLLRELERAHAHYNGVGITSITERRADPDAYRIYRALQDKGRLTVRTTITIGLDTDGTVAGTEKAIGKLPFKPGQGDDWVRIGPLKIAVDGGVLYGTAYLREPYVAAGAARLYDINEPGYRGVLRVSAEKIKNIIATGHRLGWQMSSHVAGDAGVDAILDGVEAANAQSPVAPRRYNIIHGYLPNAETARRAAKLGVVVDTQPVMYYKDGDALKESLGEDRMRRLMGVGEWRKAGVKVAINADHMQGVDPDLSLNPYNPFLAMYVVITRKTESGHVYGPEQRVSREQALRMITTDAAYLSFDEKKKGSIEIGKLADLAVLSEDLMTCPEERIKAIKAVATVVAGKVVYEGTR